MKIVDEKNRSLKQSNRYVILNTLRALKDVSIATLARSTELSKPTIKKVLDYYIRSGLVKEMGKGLSTEEGGKRPVLYRFDENYALVISVYVGPDFINSALLNFRGEIVESSYVAISREITFEKLLSIIVTHIYNFREYRGGKSIYSIVLALPGIVDFESGTLKYSPHFSHWRSDLEFKTELEKRIGKEIPIHVDNVNRYQAFIEMLEGKAVGVSDFATIDVLAEGVGSGLILGGRMNHGYQNIAGEIGHTIVNTHDGNRCICGGIGCFEAEVSWKNVLRMLEKLQEDYPDSVLYTYDSVLPVDLFAAERQGDRLAITIMDRITTYFSRGINNLILVSDPELVIIQGIYNEAGETFLQEVKRKVDGMSLLSLKRDTRICFSEFGMDRGVRGAGLYLISKFFQQDCIYQ